MSDPYQILGVSPSATDEEVKSAYRNLAKKYHPDNYADSPLADLASEKMKEVNEAYDEVMNMRKNRSQQRSYENPYNAGPFQGGYGGYANPQQRTSTDFADVRSFIVNGRISDAEQILDGVPSENRSAEWSFLKGTVLYRRGCLEQAVTYLGRACQMDPSNMEYRAAYGQISNQRSGYYGGYDPTMNPNSGTDQACNCCGNLICADACCECFGGNLIPCIGCR